MAALVNCKTLLVITFSISTQHKISDSLIVGWSIFFLYWIHQHAAGAAEQGLPVRLEHSFSVFVLKCMSRPKSPCLTSPDDLCLLNLRKRNWFVFGGLVFSVECVCLLVGVTASYLFGKHSCCFIIMNQFVGLSCGFKQKLINGISD
jgi:hypothetical protein